MTYPNGKWPDSALAPIPGGRLSKPAAAAWNAKGGPAEAGCAPGGDESSYRTIAMQETHWRIFLEGGPLAAQVGSSLHGMGVCIDEPTGEGQSWIHEHGARFGWVKNEAFSEPWHFNYDGSVHFPTFVTLKRGSKGKRVKHYTRRLAFIRHGHGPAYLRRSPGRFGRRVEDAVEQFQLDHGLKVDGEIGPATGGKIDFVFHRQYRKRHKAKPRGKAKR